MTELAKRYGGSLYELAAEENLTDEAERQRAMQRIMEKYSAEYIGTPGYHKTMKGMPAVVILALEIEALQGKGNRGRLTEG